MKNQTLTLFRIATCLVVTFCCATTYGQPTDENPVRIVSVSEANVVMKLDGSVQFGLGGRQTVQFDGWDTLEFLMNENIQKELELEDSQRTQIDRIGLDMERLEHLALMGNLKERKIPADVVSEIGDVSKKIDGLLLSHQKSRLEELKFRCEARRHGLVALLISSSLAEEFKLTSQQKVALFNRCRKIAEEYEPKVTELAKEASAQLQEELDKEQQEALTTLFGEEFMRRGIALDIFMYQLRYDPKDVTKKDKERLKGETGYEPLLHSAFFQIATDGSIYQRSRVSGELARTLLSTILNPDMLTALELTVEQEGELETFHDETRAKLAALNPESGMAYEEIKRIMEHKKKVTSAILATVPTKIHQILLPHQRERLATICGLIGVRRQGVYASLIDGFLNEKLELTAADVERIKKRAEKVLEDVGKKSMKIEEDMIKDIAESIPEDQRKLLKEKMGERVRQLPANLSTMIEQLKNPQI